MKFSKLTIFLMIISSITFICHGTTFAEVIQIKDNLILITGQRPNIRFAPTTSSEVVAQAKKGDMFKVEGKEGNWYRIIVFTGMERYVYATLAKPVKATIVIPDSVYIRKKIFLDILQAEDRAFFEATAKFPPSENQDRNVDQNRILEDRYKLKVFHKYNIQPPAYKKFVDEGINHNWDM